MEQVILLDIDGVMITAVSWRPVSLQGDEFYAFSPVAQQWLDWLMTQCNAHIILTSNHRSRYSNEAWLQLFRGRCPHVKSVQVMDDYLPPKKGMTRLQELNEWVRLHGDRHRYVIIDDDSSLLSLTEKARPRWVRTMPIMGLDQVAAEKALAVLQAH
ncbi:hypothetical protein DCC81_15975 [Chitinophaga parva]|uniref:Magnesium-dependent phosphatase-1 n=1 Tax=Chitinophaga parva TaxID=2169414 RepID=A0A2T7BHJ7_9BACT|nr:HAD domain-containing protein [Chitinophaga parva]PUZ25761.1 hypothetical protein DCC81_15975 [Chitinophaga parva]